MIGNKDHLASRENFKNGTAISEYQRRYDSLMEVAKPKDPLVSIYRKDAIIRQSKLKLWTIFNQVILPPLIMIRIIISLWIWNNPNTVIPIATILPSNIPTAPSPLKKSPSPCTQFPYLSSPIISSTSRPTRRPSTPTLRISWSERPIRRSLAWNPRSTKK